MKLIFIAITAILLVTIHAQGTDNSLEALLTPSITFAILRNLLKFTDLLTTVAELDGATIFAPNDFGFIQTAMDLGCPDTSSKLATADCFKKLGVDAVSSILKYHVVPNPFSSEQVLTKLKFSTLLGKPFGRRGLRLVDMDNSLENPKLINSLLDIEYNNGYIHGINRVLFPTMDNSPKPDNSPNPSDESSGSIVDVLEQAGKYKVLLYLIEMSKVSFSDLKNVTIFVPSDSAFQSTAEHIGCSDFSTVTAIESCITSKFTMDDITSTVLYHILPGMYSSEMILSMNALEMQNGLYTYRKNIHLVDQAPGIPNALLATGKLDMKFDGGYLHGISKVLLPVRNLPLADACDAIEFPVSLADGSFLAKFRISLGAQKCPGVLSSIQNCDLSSVDVCDDSEGAQMILPNLSFGTAVAAAKLCMDVAAALHKCPAAVKVFN